MSLKQDARLIQLGSDTYYRQRTEIYSPVGGDAILVAPVDYARRQAFSTVFGESVRGGFHDDVSVQFQYNVSARDVSTTTSGTGVVAHSGEQVSVAAGTGVGSALVTSKDAIRYRPAHEAVAQFTTVYEAAQSGVKQYHGLLNSDDAVAFGTQDGVFGVWLIMGGVETFIPQSSWLGDKCDGLGSSGFTLDPTKKNIYMVQYGWLGIAPIIWSVYTGYSTGWVVVHYHDVVNEQTIPHLHNPSLPLAMKCVRASGSGTDAKIKSSSWRAGVVASEVVTNSSNRWFANTVLEAAISGGGVRDNIFTLSNPTTFQGKTNHIVVEIGIVTFDNAGNKPVAFYGSINCTLSGATGPTPKDATNSVISLYTGGTVTAGTQGPAATLVKAGGDRRTEVLNTGLLVYPGTTFTIEAVAASAFSGNVSVSCRWVERF